ncbi:hypothetical protein [Streptomyces sp. NPDC001665]
MPATEVYDDARLRVGHLPVLVDQVGMRLAESISATEGPQGVDVVARGGFVAVVERRSRSPR